MKKNKILPALRIDSELNVLMQKAFLNLNKNTGGLRIKLEDFRRWSYKFFSEKILTEGLLLEFAPSH